MKTEMSCDDEFTDASFWDSQGEKYRNLRIVYSAATT